MRRPGVGQSGSRRISGRSTGRDPEPLVLNQPAWAEYIQTRDIRKAGKERATLELQQRQEAERAALFARLKGERITALAGDWRGRGAERNARASLIATQQAAEKRTQRERHAAEKKALRARFAPLPPYREWKLAPAIVGKIVIEEEHRLSTVLRQLEHSQDWRGRMVYRSKGVELFRDEGRRLAVLRPNSDEAIAVALAIARERFGRTLTLTGDQAFQRRVVVAAVANNLGVKFADSGLEKLRLELVAAGRRRGIEKPVNDYERIQAWKKEKRAAERGTVATVTPEPAQALEKWLKEKSKDLVAAWLAAHPGRQVIAPVPLPASGRVLAVAEDGRVLLNLGRAGDVAVYPASAGITPQVDDLVEVDKHGNIGLKRSSHERGLGRGNGC